MWIQVKDANALGKNELESERIVCPYAHVPIKIASDFRQVRYFSQKSMSGVLFFKYN